MAERVRGRPAGALVRLYPYDWQEPGPPPDAGDYVLSSGGSAYAIVEARLTRRPGRMVLTCLKLAGPSAIPAGARVVDLYWYPRDRKRRVQLHEATLAGKVVDADQLARLGRNPAFGWLASP